MSAAQEGGPDPDEDLAPMRPTSPVFPTEAYRPVSPTLPAFAPPIQAPLRPRVLQGDDRMLYYEGIPWSLHPPWTPTLDEEAAARYLTLQTLKDVPPVLSRATIDNSMDCVLTRCQFVIAEKMRCLLRAFHPFIVAHDDQHKCKSVAVGGENRPEPAPMKTAAAKARRRAENPHVREEPERHRAPLRHVSCPMIDMQALIILMEDRRSLHICTPVCGRVHPGVQILKVIDSMYFCARTGRYHWCDVTKCERSTRNHVGLSRLCDISHRPMGSYTMVSFRQKRAMGAVSSRDEDKTIRGRRSKQQASLDTAVDLLLERREAEYERIKRGESTRAHRESRLQLWSARGMFPAEINLLRRHREVSSDLVRGILDADALPGDENEAPVVWDAVAALAPRASGLGPRGWLKITHDLLRTRESRRAAPSKACVDLEDQLRLAPESGGEAALELCAYAARVVFDQTRECNEVSTYGRQRKLARRHGAMFFFHAEQLAETQTVIRTMLFSQERVCYERDVNRESFYTADRLVFDGPPERGGLSDRFSLWTLYVSLACLDWSAGVQARATGRGLMTDHLCKMRLIAYAFAYHASSEEPEGFYPWIEDLVPFSFVHADLDHLARQCKVSKNQMSDVDRNVHDVGMQITHKGGLTRFSNELVPLTFDEVAGLGDVIRERMARTAMDDPRRFAWLPPRSEWPETKKGARQTMRWLARRVPYEEVEYQFTVSYALRRAARLTRRGVYLQGLGGYTRAATQRRRR